MKKILIVILAAMLALSVAFAASADGWKELYDRKEYEAAYPALKEAADAGDPDAIAHLAACLINGLGVEADPEKAYELALRAAESGESAAVFGLGECYYAGKGVEKDLEKAAEYYRQALDAGYLLVEPAEQEHVKELLGTDAP